MYFDWQCDTLTASSRGTARLLCGISIWLLTFNKQQHQLSLTISGLFPNCPLPADLRWSLDNVICVKLKRNRNT